MTVTEAKQTVRKLVNRHGSNSQDMSDEELDRLHQATALLGPGRVFEIIADQAKRIGV